MLEWHQMKLVAGQLIAAVPFGVPGVAARFVTMPLSEVAEILDNAQASAQDVDRLKQRGLYVDVDRSGHVREPSEVTAAEVRVQLDRARRAASAATALLDPSAPLWLANPGAADGRVLPRAGQRVRRDGTRPKSRGCRGRAAERGQQASRLDGIS